MPIKKITMRALHNQSNMRSISNYHFNLKNKYAKDEQLFRKLKPEPSHFCSINIKNTFFFTKRLVIKVLN